MTVFEKIEAQQQGIENTAPWMVGEQLKAICMAEPGAAEIVSTDLDDKSRGIIACEKQIRAWADRQHRSGNCVVVPPQTAEKIIREFYGLPEKAAPQRETPETGVVDFADFL